jgi:hypothetical protein
VRWVVVVALLLAGLALPLRALAADLDADGIEDAADNCPAVSNVSQTDSAGIGSLAPDGRGNACQCGDVSGDGGAQVNDATLIRRAFAGIGPGLARSELCNTSGSGDRRDQDQDGLPDDCDLVDLVVLRRALVGLAPGIGTDCGLIHSPDAVAPRVSLTAPAEVTAGQGFEAVAQAEDEAGVTQLEIRVDGLRAGHVGSGGPLAVPVSAPDLPGTELSIEARAQDPAGNAGSATARVRVVGVPDSSPPDVSLLAPPRAAPGSQVLLRASASDDRGVAAVTFFAAGEEIGVDAAPPYEVALQVAAGAVPGSLIALEARARDASGNQASASGSVQVEAAGDASPPGDVSLSAPAQARPGQRLRASASAVDDVGILAIAFFVDGFAVGEDTSAPYEASFAVPPDRAPGERLVWTARARDFSGNATSSGEVETLLVAAGSGFVLGEVYDDVRSQPLAAARVRVVEAGGQTLDPPLELSSDARGRFSLPLAEGPAWLRIARDGYSDAERSVEVLPGGVSVPLDARLTPRAQAQAVDPVAGTSLASDGLSLALPPGAFAGPTPVRVTALSEQALPVPLPPGWAPLAAAELSADLPLQAEVRLELALPAVPASAVAAHWDSALRHWRRVPLEASELTADVLGAYALAVPDAGMVAPQIGAALPESAGAALAASDAAQILPSPRILFLDPAARSQVTARVESPVALPSGTPIAVQFSESYLRTDGSRLSPEGSTQDFLLYRRASGFQAQFAATPSDVFGAALLQEGVIDLAALAPSALPGTSAPLDSAGGQVSSDGASLEIPAGALGAPVVARLARIPSADVPSGMGFAGGVQLDLGAAALAAPGVLRIGTPAGLPPDAQVLVVRSALVAGATRLELVGIAAREASELVLRPGALGLPLSGADAEGRYLFVTPAAPVGFVAGVVSPGPGVALQRALLETSALPFVSLPDAADPRFALAAVPGPVDVSGTELVSGARASGAVAVLEGGVAALNLTLESTRPAVESVDPADLAAQVDVDAAITVQFSRPLARESVTSQTFRLFDGDTPVAGQLFVGLGARTVTFRPDAPLRGLSAYTVALSDEIRDDFGNPLLGNQADGSYASVFETWDTSPPAPPPPGRITLSIPRDGETEIRGTPGTLAAGMLMFAFNLTAATSTAAVVEPDGSFFARLGASSDDEVVLAVQSLAGEITRLDPIPFTDPDGWAVLSPRGGSFTSDGGVELSALPGALVRTDEVRLSDLPAVELPGDLPVGFTALRGFRLEVPPALVHSVGRLELIEETGRIIGAERGATPLRIEASRVTGAGVTTTTRFAFVARSGDAQGVERAVRVDATGNPTACTGSLDAASDAVAPRLRLRAPTCIGPQQAFSVRAEAIQPRFDLEADAFPGDAPGTPYVLLRRVEAGGSIVWALAETARVELELGATRVVTESRSPFGLRSSGDYVIARADSALGFVEGVVSGEAALVVTDLSGVGAETAGSNGAFLLAVPAGRSFALRTLSPEDGAERSSEALAAVGSGATAFAGFVGPAAPTPLAVNALPQDGGTVSPTAPVVFGFNGPVDASTVSLSSLFVLDAEGRLVDGERISRAGGALVEFRPRRPWRGGETYSWRVTTEVTAQDGARLPADATGSFAGFEAALLATIGGEDVRDAVARGSVIHLIDGNRLRSIDAVDPAAANEGMALELSPTPNRLALDAAHGSLLLTAGSTSEYGEVVRLDLASALAPGLSGRLRVSTPSGAAPIAGAAPRPGMPASLALLSDALAISNRGIGLQRIDLAALEGGPPATPPLAFPPGGASFADVASAGALLASLGPPGLQLHDPTSLEVLASTPVDGTPADLELAVIDGRRLALVAAGLSGGVQIFEISDPDPDDESAGGVPNAVRVASILPGCSAQRIASDPPMRRAWLACPGTRVASLDLANIDGLERIDADGDGADDRVGASFSIPIGLVNFGLDAPRNLGLVSAGPQGLAVLQLGGAEVRIADVVRDPLRADLRDAESILASGRAHFGDHELRAEVDARIPPGHPGLLAELDAGGPVSFSDGSASQALVPGRNELRLIPAGGGAEGTGFSLRVVEAPGAPLARWVGRLEPVPLGRVVATGPSQSEFSGAGDVQLEIFARGPDDEFYNVTSLAEFSVTDPELGSIGPDRVFHAVGGGRTSIRYRIGSSVGGIVVSSTLPPAVVGLDVEPRQPRLTLPGASAELGVRGRFSDGSSAALGISDGVVFSSGSPAVALVDAGGSVRAAGEGVAEIEIRLGDVSTTAFVTVAFDEPPDVDGIEIDRAPADVFTDEGSLLARGRLLGSGLLGSIPVAVEVAGPGVPQLDATGISDENGFVDVALDALSGSGAATLTLRVVDPADGTAFSASAPFAMLPRNADLEPNQPAAAAVPLEPFASVEGALDAAQDPADLYRLVLANGGTLVASVGALDGAMAGLRLLDESGAVIGVAEPSIDEETGEIIESSLALELPAGAVLLEVGLTDGAGAYVLGTSFDPATPRVDGIEPASAAPGATVAIRGAGFGASPQANTVLFSGVVAEVVAAQPDRIVAIVPTFATDGPLQVWVAGRASPEVPFTTGQAGSPDAFRVHLPDDVAAYIRDASGQLFSPDRLQVGIGPSVPQTRVAQIAQALGGSIVEIEPRLSIYTLEFTGGSGMDRLMQLRESLLALPEVKFAARVSVPNPEGNFIAGRDSMLDQPDLLRAAQQVRLFEAWEAIVDSGQFDTVGAFSPVKVAVIDDLHFSNSKNDPAFEGGFFGALNLVPLSPPCKVGAGGLLRSHATSVVGLLAARNRVSLVGPTGSLMGAFSHAMNPPHTVRVLQSCEGEAQMSEGFTNVRSAGGLFDVVNMSFAGLNQGPDAADQVAWLRLAVSASPGTLYVAAAGNENLPAEDMIPAALGDDSGSLSSPGVKDQFLTVGASGLGVSASLGGSVQPPCPGATQEERFRRLCADLLRIAAGTAYDHGTDTKLAFSNFGAAVDIAAPGVGLPTVNSTPTGTGLSFEVFSGTSGAAPLVAGVAALLKSLRPSLRPQDLHRILVDTATPIGGLPEPQVPGHFVPSVRLRWHKPGIRRLDALAAVQLVLACNAQGPSGPCPPNGVVPPTDPVGATQKAPGRRRSVWIADNTKGSLHYVRFPKDFSETSFNPRKAQFNLSANCPNPRGLAHSIDGGKLYVACENRDQLLLWNANTRSLGRWEGSPSAPLIDVGASLSVVEGNMRLAASPDGNFVAIPAKGSVGSLPKVSVIDARKDGANQQIALQGARGSLVAVAFGRTNDLYALTAEKPSIGRTEPGTLFRIPRRAGARRDDQDGWDAAGVQPVQLELDSPRGIEIRRIGADEIIYVYYSGDRAGIAASAHEPDTLAEIPQSRIGDRLTGHLIGLVPGAEVPPFGSLQGQQILTSTQRAFDMEVDDTDGLRGFFLFGWTGNLGFMKSPARVFDGMAAVTRIRGEAKQLRKPNPSLGFVDARFEKAEFESETELVPRYLTTEFGQVMDLEQGGELIVAGFAGGLDPGTGQRGFLQAYFPERLDLAAQRYLAPNAPSPLQAPIDQLLQGTAPYISPPNLTPPDVFRRLRIDATGLDAPRDVDFMPRLSVLAPRAEETLRGAVGVNVVVRDERITRITCSLRSDTGTTISPGPDFGAGGVIPFVNRKLGFTWRTGPGSTIKPLCFFKQLPTGTYDLEVRGTGGARDAVGRVRFRYERTP